MAIPMRSPVASGPPTFDQTFTRLVLWASPFIALYLVIAIGLAILSGPWGALLILPLAGLGLWTILRALGGAIREVPHMTALILSRRDNHRLEALRLGFYLRPDPVFKTLAQVSLRPSEGEQTVEHVALRGGPPLTIRLAYTMRPNWPLAVNSLPRGRQGEDVHDRDMRTVGYLILAHNLPERWARVNGNVIEREIRVFLSGLQVTDIYDPAGATLDYADLLTRLNAHLRQAVEPELGFQVHAHNLVVLNGNTRAVLDWRRRLAQMQQLAGWARTLPPEQLLLLMPLFQRLSGDAAGPGLDPTLLYLLWGQMGQGGAGWGGGPNSPGTGPGWPPSGPVPLRPGGPHRPAA